MTCRLRERLAGRAGVDRVEPVERERHRVGLVELVRVVGVRFDVDADDVEPCAVVPAARRPSVCRASISAPSAAPTSAPARCSCPRGCGRRSCCPPIERVRAAREASPRSMCSRVNGTPFRSHATSIASAIRAATRGADRRVRAGAADADERPFDTSHRSRSRLSCRCQTGRRGHRTATPGSAGRSRLRCRR
jgi:hypothetical protein